VEIHGQMNSNSQELEPMEWKKDESQAQEKMNEII
jgi:hypothetical protein